MTAGKHPHEECVKAVLAALKAGPRPIADYPVRSPAE